MLSRRVETEDWELMLLIHWSTRSWLDKVCSVCKRQYYCKGSSPWERHQSTMNCEMVHIMQCLHAFVNVCHRFPSAFWFLNSLMRKRETLMANPATSKSPWATERHKTCSSKCWKERRITKPCPSAKSVCKDLGRWGFGSFWIPKSITDIIRYQVSLPHQAWMHQ